MAARQAHRPAEVGAAEKGRSPMQISSRFTVAVHILLCIAYFDGTFKTTSTFIADSVGVNPVIVRKTLGQLKAAGLVEVEAGVGGASLARDPADVTLLDVFRATESVNGSLFSFHEHPNPKCPVGRSIHAALDGELAAAQQALEGQLTQTSLQELIGRIGLAGRIEQGEPAGQAGAEDGVAGV